MSSATPADYNVQHLVELGYSDPQETTTRNTVERQQLTAESTRINELSNAGEYADAIALIRSLLQSWPEDASLRFQAAQWFQQHLLHKVALQQLAELMYQGVETAPVAALRGEVLLSLRQLPDAIDQLEYARHLDEYQPGIHRLLGEAYARTEQDKQAKDAYEADLELNEENPLALDGLAALALRQSQYNEAADLALRALTGDMKLATAHYRLGISLLHLDKLPEAVQALETAIHVSPTIISPFRTLARLSLGDQERGQEIRAEVSRRIELRQQIRRQLRQLQASTD